MRIRLALAALLLTLPVGLAADQVTSIRVLTYNIRHGQGMDGIYDLERIAEIIRGTRPDVVSLQEVDRGTERSGRTDQVRRLAEMLGMYGEFGKAIDFQGGEYGVAVLSRWPIHYADNRALPSSPPYYEPRTALTVFTRVGGDGPLLQVTATHLDDARDSPDRWDQAAALNDLLVSGDGRPSILAGDFNARGDADLLALVERYWANVASAEAVLPQGAPTNRRGLRSDFVFFRPREGWKVVDWQVIDAPPEASDHRPVLAVLEWTGGR